MIYLSTNKAILGGIGAVIIVVSSYLLGTLVSSRSENENEDSYFKNLINTNDEPFVNFLEDDLNVDEMKRHLEYAFYFTSIFINNYN